MVRSDKAYPVIARLGALLPNFVFMLRPDYKVLAEYAFTPEPKIHTAFGYSHFAPSLGTLSQVRV